jgi:LysM repeat protein
MIKKVFDFLIIALVAVFFASCARAPVKTVLKETLPVRAIPEQIKVQPRHDIFHSAGPGETVWRISKMYDVKIEDIVAANDLKDATELAMGQRLRIPNAAPIKPVVSLYRSNKWSNIIIHHSATDEGDALNFYKFHRSKGWESLGYHFVIDNGTEGKVDGQIEVSPRWTKQLNGAHCQAGNMNCKGIGVCLVGNFNKDRVSDKQLESLVYLVSVLRKYYKIPASNILGHKQVKGAKTDCPGQNFPWNEFRGRLNAADSNR